MRGVAAEGATFGQRFQAAANGLSSFAIRVGAVGGILAAFAIHAATAFQSAQAQVHAFAGASQRDTAAMSASALHLSTVYGESATKIAGSMYDVYSAGIRGKQALDIERAGTEAAATSHGKLDDVMKALVTTMLDYPHAFKNAHDAAGEMTRVVQEGRMHWDEYARSISTVEPLASGLGIPFSQLGAMLVQLTRHGNTANESTMMLRNALMQTIMPNVQARNTYAALGLSVQDLMKHHANLITHLHSLVLASQRHTLSEREVADATGYHGIRAARLTELLKSHDATLRLLSGTSLSYSAIMQTMGNRDYPSLVKAQEDITNGAKALDVAWAAVSQTTETRGARLREEFRTLGIVVGTILLPAFNAVMGVLLPIGEQLGVLASQHQRITGIIAGTAVALLAFGVALKAGLVIVDMYRQSWIVLRGALEAMGIISKTREATDLLTAGQQRGTVQTQLRQAAEARLRSEYELSAASARGDMEEVNRLTTAISNLSATEERAVTAMARQSIAQSDLGEATNASVVAQEELQSAENRLVPTITRVSEVTKQLEATQWANVRAGEEQRNAWQRMSLANNELSSSTAALRREMDALGATTYAEQESVIANTEAGERWQAAVLRQQMAVRDLSSANQALTGTNKELQATQDQVVVATDQATIAQNELNTARERALAANGEVVAANEAVIASDTEAAASSGLLATALGALGVTEGVVTAVTGALAAVLGVLLSPIGLIVIAIGALVVGFVLLYTHCQTFHDTVNRLVGLLENGLYAAGQKIMFIFNALSDIFSAVGSKLDSVTGSGTALLDIIQVIAPELIPVVQLFEHWDQIMGALIPRMDQLARKTGDFLGIVGSHLPGWTGFVTTTHNVGDALAATGAKMDASGQTMAYNTDILGQMTTGMKGAAGSARGLGTGMGELTKAEKDAAAATKSVNDSIRQMTAQVDQDLASLDDHTTKRAEHQANAMIANAARARVGVITQIRALAAEMAVPLKLPPIQRPDLSGLHQRFTAGPTEDTTKSASVLAGALDRLGSLRTSLDKLPPAFKAASDSLVSGIGKQITAAHSDFMQKLHAENVRHAQALTTLQTTERQQLRAEFERAQQARKTEDNSYLSRLKTIEDDHAQRVAQYLQTQAIAAQTSASTFQASMAQFDNRLNEINQAHTTAMQNLNNQFHAKMAALHGKYDGDARARLKTWYDNEKTLINTRINNEKTLVQQHIDGLARAFRDHNQRQIEAMTNWLRNEKSNYERHISGLNTTHKQHVAAINAAHQRHVQGIKDAHTNHVNHENNVHNTHVSNLTHAFQQHVEKIEKALKQVMTPGGQWDKLASSAQSLADNALKGLALKIAEHQKVTTADIKAVVDAQKAQNQMNAAMAKAEKDVLAMGGSGKKAKESLDSIATAVNNQYKKAMDDVTRDILAGREPSAKHLAALQAAVTAQNKLTVAQARAQAIAEADGAKHKKTADEWIKALSDAKNAVDTQFNSAVAKWVLAVTAGSTAVSHFENQATAAAQQQQGYVTREAQINAIVQANLLGLGRAAGVASAAFDQLKNTASSRLDMALKAAAQEYMATGRISAGTAASLQKLQANSDSFDAAMTAAKNAATGVTASFEDLTKQANEQLNTALNNYAMALYKASQGDAAAAASLAGLQQQAVAAQIQANGLAAASKKAADAVNALANVTNVDFNATLQAAQAKLEDAKAALADAIAHGASADAIDKLRQAADAAAIEVNRLQQAMKDAEQMIADDTGIDESGGDSLTPYQKFEEGMQQQKFQLQQANDTFGQNLDTQKLALAQQKAADQEQKRQFDEQLALAKLSLQEEKKQSASQALQVQALQQMLANDNKLLYLSRLGLSRTLVGSGNETSFLNNLGGQSFSLTSAY
jgi:hypothetical protein